MSMTKHVGRLKNTGTRIAVVFRRLEGDESNCLICETERLPDLLHNDIMDIINGKMGQSTVNLYEALSKSRLSSGEVALDLLHKNKYLKKVPISTVEMLPYPTKAIPLSYINDTIDGKTDSSTPVDFETPETEKTSVTEPSTQQNTPTSDNEEENKAIAQNLIVQAELMENDAKSKREEAYKLDPSLKPSSKTKSNSKDDKRKKTAEEKAKTQEERNARRRESYKKKKEKELDKKLSAQVAEKIERDAKNAEKTK